jgi:hypothetical protein
MHPLTIIKRGDAVPPRTMVLYCGRGSPLGNPHVMRGKSQRERDRVCDLYAAEFPTPEQKKECERIMEWLDEMPVALECFCVPKRCHCETPRDYILKHITV